MTRDELMTILVMMIAEYMEPPLAEDQPLSLDSLTIVMLVEGIEDRFDVRVAPREVTPSNFATLRALADFLEHKTTGAGSAP